MAYVDGEDDSRLASDGLERSSDRSPLDDAAGADTGELDPVEHDLGFILTADPEDVAKFVIQQRDDQKEFRSRNRATWKRNKWWREGRRNIRLEKRENQSVWEAKMPAGMASAPPVPNKTDRLCRRLTNTILVDKPYPECSPGGDDAQDEDAAEFATRYLVEKGEKLNMTRISRSALDKANTFASAFAWVTMDPYGGGHRPRSVDAHPQARTMQDATIDPMTGAPAPDSALQKRFVRPDSLLTDDPTQADIQWLPDHKVRLITGLQLDFLPPTCRGIDDADGVVITDITSLGDLRKSFPDAIEALTESELTSLCNYKPQNVEDILPPYTRMPVDQKYTSGPKTGKWMDAQLVFITSIYYVSSSEYPFGAYAVIGGNSLVLHRQKWSAMMLGPDGQAVEECLELPIAQDRCLDDDINDNPYGIAISEHLGPADEVRNTALGYELEHMFRAGNPIPFIPIGSIVQPKAFLKRDGTPIMVNPNGKPDVEHVEPLSETVQLVRNEMGTEMDDESGLQQAGQGVEGPTVKSGIHAQTIVAEALKAVTTIKDNAGDFYIRLSRLILQHARAFITVPDMLSYAGEDGGYKAKEFTRTDFRTTKNVSIQKGTFTMHTLLAKQEMANNAFDRKVIDADQYNDMMSTGISPVLGSQDDPALMRIRRQLDVYMEGPTPEWLQQQQAYESQQQAVAIAQRQQASYQQGAATAQQAGQPVPPPPPMDPATLEQPMQPPAGPFTRLPVDLEPMPAKIRHRQITRVMNGSKFSGFPPPWQQVLLAEYAEMKNAAGIMTVPEIQQAKQAEAQQQAELAKQTAAAAQAQAEATAQKDRESVGLDRDRLALERRKVEGDLKAKTPVAPGPLTIRHERDASGKVVASHVIPSAAPAGPPAPVVQHVQGAVA